MKLKLTWLTFYIDKLIENTFLCFLAKFDEMLILDLSISLSFYEFMYNTMFGTVPSCHCIDI